MDKRIKYSKPSRKPSSGKNTNLILPVVVGLAMIGCLGAVIYMFLIEHPMGKDDLAIVDRGVAIVTGLKTDDVADKDSFVSNGCILNVAENEDANNTMKQVSVLNYLRKTSATKVTTDFSNDKIKSIIADAHLKNAYSDTVKDFNSYVKNTLKNSYEIKATEAADLYAKTYGSGFENATIIWRLNGYVYDKDRNVFYADNNNMDVTTMISGSDGIGCAAGDTYYIKDHYSTVGDNYYLYVGEKKLDIAFDDDTAKEAKYTPSKEDLKNLPKYRFVFKKDDNSIKFVKFEEL